MKMLKTISSKVAAALDKELMSTQGFTLDQLMELAGLSVAHAVYKSYPPNKYNQVVILSGPGNNGGDGLVAARHLKLLGYSPTVFYYKRGPKFSHLETQLKSFSIPLNTEPKSVEQPLSTANIIVDALFGFSFRPPLREPFGELVKLMNQSKAKVVSVDMPSGWDVDKGPEGIENEEEVLKPDVLVSLTAPKPGSAYFKGEHYLGGRFVSDAMKEKYDLQGLDGIYQGVDQVTKL